MANEGEWREVFEPNLHVKRGEQLAEYKRKLSKSDPPPIQGSRKCKDCQEPATHTNGLGIWACKEHAHD